MGKLCCKTMKGMIHMKKLLLIAGHGEGDPGAISK